MDKANRLNRTKKLAALLMGLGRPQAQGMAGSTAAGLLKDCWAFAAVFLLTSGCFKNTCGISVARGSPPAKVAVQKPPAPGAICAISNSPADLPCLTKALWAGSYQWATLSEVEEEVGKGTGATFELEDALGTKSSSPETSIASEPPETLERQHVGIQLSCPLQRFPFQIKGLGSMFSLVAFLFKAALCLNISTGL